MLKTFKDWSQSGFSIRKGSKASWVDGVAMFSDRQVYYSPPHAWVASDADDLEEDSELANFYGISPWGN